MVFFSAFSAPTLAGEGDRLARALVSQDAVFALSRYSPEFSAHLVATSRQKLSLAVAGALLAAMCVLWPREMAQMLVAAMSFGFIASLTLRIILVWHGRRKRTVVEQVHDDGLPVYTVLVPLYHEAAVLPQLVNALLALDYPGIMAQTPLEWNRVAS